MTTFAAVIWFCASAALCSNKNPRWAQGLGLVVFALPVLGYAAGFLR
jgi:hypothetical protein